MVFSESTFPSHRHVEPDISSPSENREHLRRALSDVLAGDLVAMAQVRKLVRAVVGGLRDQGTTPERMLIEMKSIALSVPDFETVRANTRGQAEVLMWRFVRCCVESYYAPSE
jgi:hypothetical protein